MEVENQTVWHQWVHSNFPVDKKLAFLSISVYKLRIRSSSKDIKYNIKWRFSLVKEDLTSTPNVQSAVWGGDILGEKETELDTETWSRERNCALSTLGLTAEAQMLSQPDSLTGVWKRAFWVMQLRSTDSNQDMINTKIQETGAWVCCSVCLVKVVQRSLGSGLRTLGSSEERWRLSAGTHKLHFS